MSSAPMIVRDADVLVIGSGLAGMTTALRLAPRRVTLVAKTDDLPGGSSFHAQGGIAVALAPDDTPESHTVDTLRAGAGLVDEPAARLLTAEGPQRIRELIARGVPFDTGAAGELLFGREAAHAVPRVVHSGGDATGRNVSLAMADLVRNTPSITVETGIFVVDLIKSKRRVRGALARSRDGWILFRSAHVVLATGGIGQVYTRTTNPAEATGDGPALAARAGATLNDMEFVQFHPTALVAGDDASKPASLLTEALRGAGAVLLDEAGRRFMLDEHEAAELAPRDVVARAIGRRIAAGERVFLDMRPALAAKPKGFPTCERLCAEAGLDPKAAPVPVGPAAHYHMGGVWTDLSGRTDVPGLWACGEVASTGVHGANRLASNSLLETLVFGARVADDIAALPVEKSAPLPLPDLPDIPVETAAVARIASDGRATMYEHVGLVRDAAGLERAERTTRRLLRELDSLETTPGEFADPDAVRAWGEARDRLTVGRLIIRGALNRTESRGAHTRLDHPDREEPARHQPIRLSDLDQTPMTASGVACPTL